MNNQYISAPHWAPQQNLYLLKTLPPRPDPFDVTLYNFGSEPWDDNQLIGVPADPNKNSIYLGTVEWVWDFAHDRTERLFLHQGATHWFLWFGLNHGDGWEWMPGASASRTGVSREQAAIYLLLEHFREDYPLHIGSFDYILERGTLEIAYLNEIKERIE